VRKRDVRQVFLRPESTQYIIDYLNHSTTLMQLALRGRDSAHGTVSTYIPLDLDVTSERLHQFEWSIHPPPVLNEDTMRHDAAGNRIHVVPTEMLDDLLVRVIQDYLLTGPDRICIFESGMRKSEDIGFGGYVGDAAVIEHGDEGYFLLTYEHADKPDHILETVEIARFPRQIAGVFALAPDDVDLTPDKATFSSTELHSLATATTAIIVGAYDEEGFLVWQFS